MDYKVIIKHSIARQLLHKGNEIKDIKPKKENPLETVFVFEQTEKLKIDLTNITK
jgi:replicative DNA helicase